MAQPGDSATTLKSVGDVIEELYFNEFVPQTFFDGSATLAIVEMSDLDVEGDGLHVKNKLWGGDSVRTDTDALSDFPLPDRFEPKDVKIRWDERTPANNDFTKFHCTARISEYEKLKSAGAGSIVDIADELYDDLMPNFRFRLALALTGPHTQPSATNGMNSRNFSVASTASSGATSTFKRLDDFPLFTNCTTYSSGTTCRVVIDAGAIAAFREGSIWDVYNSTGTLVTFGIRVSNVNVVDTGSGGVGTVGFERAFSDTSVSSSSMDGITTSCTFHPAGSRNKGIYGPGAYFTMPVTGDSFITGANRLSARNRFFLPTILRSGLSTLTINQEIFDTAGDAVMNFMDGAKRPWALQAHQSLLSTLRATIKDGGAFMQWPLDNPTYQRHMHFGSMGLHWQHPGFGSITFMADPLMSPNKVRLMRAGDWKMLFYGKGGRKLRFMDGENGPWYRMQSATAGAGKSMFWQVDAYTNLTGYCLKPKAQVEVQNLAA